MINIKTASDNGIVTNVIVYLSFVIVNMVAVIVNMIATAYIKTSLNNIIDWASSGVK